MTMHEPFSRNLRSIKSQGEHKEAKINRRGGQG